MMTFAQVVESPVNINNDSSFQKYTHPDDQIGRTTDTPGFKPFTFLQGEIHYSSIIIIYSGKLSFLLTWFHCYFDNITITYHC